MSEACRKYVGNMSEPCRKHVGFGRGRAAGLRNVTGKPVVRSDFRADTNMSQTCHKYVPNMSELCSKYVPEHHGAPGNILVTLF